MSIAGVGAGIITSAGITSTGSVYNVRDNGARGDGITNDYGAIQATINKAITGGGGVIYFPVGVYVISNPLVLGNTFQAPLSLIGVGWSSVVAGGSDILGSVLQASSASLTSLIDYSNTNRTVIYGLRLLAVNAPNNTVGCQDDTGGSGYVTIWDNHFRYFGGDAIRQLGNVSRIMYNSVRLNNNGAGHIIHLHGGASDSFIAFNDIGSTLSGIGIYLDGATNGSQVCTIIGNEVFNCSTGILLTNTSLGNRIIGNRCEKHQFHGIEDNTVLGGVDWSGNLIEGNSCFNNGSGVGGGNSSGIHLHNCKNTNVVGNRCFDDGESDPTTGNVQKIGVLLNGANDCLVTGNQIHDITGPAGIYCFASARNLITSNYIRHVPQHGIEVTASGSNDNRVLGNYVYEAGFLTDNAYHGIVVDNSANTNNIAHNTVRAGGLANKIQSAVRINDAGCTGNIVTENDILGQGNATAGDYADAGTGTGFRQQLMVQSIAYAANITPDALVGEDVVVGALTGAILVNAPLHPRIGMRLHFNFVQDGAGGHAVTWNAVFKQAWSDVGNGAGKKSSISYRNDGTNWVQEAAQGPYV